MNADDIRRIVADSVALKERFFTASAPLLLEVGRRLGESLLAGGRVLAFGNGGSAADAQHFVAELVGRFQRERAGLSAIALTTDPSVVTAVSNAKATACRLKCASSSLPRSDRRKTPATSSRRPAQPTRPSGSARTVVLTMAVINGALPRAIG